MVDKRDWHVFLCSVFFVLGFSVVFAVVGVVLQALFSSAAPIVQKWLGRIGGLLIIFFGLYTLGLINIPYLNVDRKIAVKKRFSSMYLTSFVFGAAFAVGWTPCVGAILGAILALAATNPGSAFFLMIAYALGLGVPFLIVGLFANQMQGFLSKEHAWIRAVEKIFGGFLIFLGILVFTNRLSVIANLGFVSSALVSLNFGGLMLGTSLNLGIAFVAGVLSFLSPCVLPLIPAFLSYLTITAVKRE